MSIDIEGLMAQLVGQSETGAQMRELEASVAGLSAHAADTLAEALKRQVDKYVREKDGIPRAEGFVGLLLRLSELTGNALHRALGLRAEGNVHLIGLSEYAEAIALYDAAAEIYEQAGCELEAAQALVGKVGGFAVCGQYDEARAVFEQISPIFEAHQEWLLLAGVALNLGVVYSRLGEDAKALSWYDQAAEFCEQSGITSAKELAITDNSRATALYHLGHFEAAIQASRRAYELASELEISTVAARAQQTLGFLYFWQGRSTEALKLLEDARDFFLADQRPRDAGWVELDASYCLLRLRHFNRVLNKSLEVRRLFASLEEHAMEAQAILNAAIAYAGRREYEKSLAALAEARQLYEAEGNQVWAAVTDLEKAAVLYRQEQFEASLATAQSCATLFQAHGLPLRAAQAQLMAARAAAQKQPALARRFVSDALAVSEGNQLLGLTYQGRHLLGQLAYAQGAWPVAEAEYRAAIEVLERLCGRVMTEFRADFLEDKQDVYGDMVGLLLEGGQLAQAFTYVERAKSRALLDLLAYQLDLSLHPKVANDAPLVADLARLQGARNQLLRRWQSQRTQARQQGQPVPVSEQQQNQQALLTLEQQITEGWHQLLIRNADYARQATLWQPRAESVQPYLPPGTALLEYFPVGQNQKLCAFLVTPDSIQVCFLPATLSQIGRAFKKLQKLNLNKVPRSRPARVAGLALNAQGLLHQLYGWLIAPLQKHLAAYPRLIIVPHDTLHYLPFHALYDGASFLIESHEISYLPSASLLRYCQEVTPAEGRNVVLGYSNQNHLPHAVSEARTIAGLLEGELLLEEDATLARLQEIAPQCALLHLATHGEFREDNPLFSGLTLADGSLTTLDIFNLRLRASLVTLSACQTGKHKIGGGDELLGLTRAFLYAGAASLLLSHWKVADNATAQFMETFYQQLSNGATNSAALRYAQLQFLRPDDPHPAKPYAHPYFWASFFLIGDTRTVCT